MLLNFILQFIAKSIRWVRINRVKLETLNGVAVVRKSRTPFCWPLIAIGNFTFKFRKVPVKVLYTQRWVEWEHSVAHARGNDFGNLDDSKIESLGSLRRTVIMKRIHGKTLFRILDEGNLPRREKLSAAAKAFQSLLELHQIKVKPPSRNSNGKDVNLSHGDASIQNVIYDSANHSAVWFDFDLRHDLTTPDFQRHADDLRSLLFTLGWFFADSVDELVKLAIANYPNQVVWSALNELLSKKSFQFDLFHRSQILRSLPAKRDVSQNSSAIERLLRDSIANSITNPNSLVGD